MDKKWSNDRDIVKNMVNAIRLKCIDCSCWSVKEVEECFDHDCPLYPYRMDGDTSRSQIAILQGKR